MSVQRVLKVGGWCTRQGFRVSLWTTWVLLLAILAGQVYLLSARRVPVPQVLRKAIEERLAAHGLRLSLGRSVMSLAGRFILEDVRLGTLGTPEPLITVRAVYVHLDPWDLLLGQIDINEVRVSGLDFHLPPIRSASGADEVVASNVDFELRPAGNEMNLSYFTGYIGRIPVQASGSFSLPAARAVTTDPRALLERLAATYLTFASKTQAADAWLAALESPRMRLRLSPDDIAVDFRADTLDLGAFPGGPGGKLTGLRVNTRLSLRDLRASPLEITGAVDSLALPREITARELQLRLGGKPGGALGFEPSTLEFQLGSLRWKEMEAGPLAGSATRDAGQLVNADVSFAFAGSPWRLQGRATPHLGTAQVWLDGFVDDAVLAFAGSQIGKNLSALLDPTHPAPLHATASFGPGWKLAEASGRLHSGPVRVGGALLDETGTEFFYDGTRAVADNLVLRQGDSLAHGSYEMNTKTLDFRFLLAGGLRPMGIESWFHGWWTNFWASFDFSRGLPVADVDVRGRWGDLTATQVFVQAEGGETGLKGVPFDRVRTRLFLRPQWFDILHFEVLQAGRGAHGSLLRSQDLRKDAWDRMEFSVESSLPLDTISALFKKESAELLAPYRFTEPPTLQLTGWVQSEAAATGKKEHIDITLASTGPMTYHAFPLSDLKFEARLRDDEIELPVLSVGFAEGVAKGKARLWGAEDARRLSFDISLADASLGAVTQTVSRLQPPAAPTAEKPSEKAAEAARQRQERLERGRLAFTLAAEGRYTDYYSFKGTGHAAITGAELAQLNLFGPLSEALRKTAFNFGSFSLTTADAPFTLDGKQVRFETLRITGPNALLQAKGDYQLRDGSLDFTAKLNPFEENDSVVGSAVDFVLTPFSKVFEVKLTGSLSDPSWVFAYGPTRLINSITGGEKNPRAPDNSAAVP